MKLSLIGSPHDFGLLNHVDTSYHLVLAQQLLFEPDYISYYKAKRIRGDFIIVDNGAAELGESLPFDDVLQAAEQINADEICLPDKLKDADRTLDLHYKYYQKVPSYRRMAIPQGKDGKEWLYCLDELLDILDFFSVGVPKHLDDSSEGRMFVLGEMERRGYHKMFHVHLLGCNKAPLYEVKLVQKNFPWVRGIDTAAPLAYAQASQTLNYGKHISYNWHTPTKDRECAIKNMIDLLEATS